MKTDSHSCVHLIDFYWSRDKDPRIPLGHASLRCSLEQAGLTVRPHVHAVNDTDEQVVEYIVEEVLATTVTTRGRVDVAIGAYVWAEARVKRCIQLLREHGFMGRIILGGPQISYSTDCLEDLYPGVDAFVRGYGEQALCQIASAPGHPSINGVHWAGTPDRRDHAKIDLAAIPSPWLTGMIPLQGQRFIRWETQRGCSFRCAFCQHREPGERLTRKQLDRARIFKEIELFCHHGVEDIAVLDPIFNLPRTHAVAVLEAFARHGYQGRLSLQCRAEGIDEAFIQAAAKLNTRLEFGLQTTHLDESIAIDRQNNLARVEAALELVRAHDIDHEVSLIFGLPLQTLDSFKRSVQWCLDQRIPVIKAFPLMLLRGTKLETERETWGLRTQPGGYPEVIASHSFDEIDRAQMALISDALANTEGNHPRHIEELLGYPFDAVQHASRFCPRSLT